MKYANLPPTHHVGVYNYNQKAHLGSGSFGKVFLGKDANNAFVAIKEMDKKQFQENPYLFNALESEINLQKSISSKYTVQLLDVVD